jgi:hypothetical protein
MEAAKIRCQLITTCKGNKGNDLMNTVFTRKPTAVVLSAILLIATTAGSVTSAVAAQSTDSVVEVDNEGWNNPGMRQIAVHTGREVVHHLVAAQEAIEQGQSGKALGNVIAANRLNDSVIQMMPYVTVTTDLFNAKGKLAMEETDLFYDDLLPIYAGLDALEVYAPQLAQQANSKLKQAEKMAREGKTTEAAGTLQEVIVMISETGVYLPVVYVHGQLQAAQNALSETKRDVATAKVTINNALESLAAFTEEVVVEAEPAS